MTGVVMNNDIKPKHDFATEARLWRMNHPGTDDRNYVPQEQNKDWHANEDTDNFNFNSLSTKQIVDKKKERLTEIIASCQPEKKSLKNKIKNSILPSKTESKNHQARGER